MVDSVRLGGFEGPHVRSNCKPELKRHDPLLIAIDSGCQIVPETFGTDRLFFASGRRFAPVLGDSAGAPRTAASTKRSRGITEQIARTARSVMPSALGLIVLTVGGSSSPLIVRLSSLLSISGAIASAA